MQEAGGVPPQNEPQPTISEGLQHFIPADTVNPTYTSEPQISSKLAPPPSWFKETAKTVLDAWFDPKSFESQEAYERLGMKQVKKWLPTTGDKVYKAVWMRLGFPKFIHGKNDLKGVETFTRVYEAIHIAGFGYLAEQAAENFANGRIGAGIFTTAINALVT